MKILYMAGTIWLILQEYCELSSPLWAHLGTQSPFITRLLWKNVLSIPKTDLKLNFQKRFIFFSILLAEFFVLGFVHKTFSYFLVGIHYFTVE